MLENLDETDTLESLNGFLDDSDILEDMRVDDNEDMP